jgi:hypothetical protein
MEFLAEKECANQNPPDACNLAYLLKFRDGSNHAGHTFTYNPELTGKASTHWTEWRKLCQVQVLSRKPMLDKTTVSRPVTSLPNIREATKCTPFLSRPRPTTTSLTSDEVR